MLRASLRLLTWNLGRWHLGERLNRWLGLDSRASDRDLDHVARVIAGAGADVVALQELRDGGQAERLAARLGEDWRAATPDERCDRRVALLARMRLDPVFAPFVTSTGRSAQSAALRVVRDGGEERWAVASWHFDAFDAAARARQARDLLAWSAARTEDAVVVAGDLNLDLAHPAARRAVDPSTYGALSRVLVDLGADAGPTTLGRRRLDYVLARAGVDGRVEVLRGRRVRLGDHDPVVAHLRRRATPG